MATSEDWRNPPIASGEEEDAEVQEIAIIIIIEVFLGVSRLWGSADIIVG